MCKKVSEDRKMVTTKDYVYLCCILICIILWTFFYNFGYKKGFKHGTQLTNVIWMNMLEERGYIKTNKDGGFRFIK